MIALLGLMVFSLWFLGSLGIQVLADSQAYNSAAATWSAAEHEASYHLTQYAATRNAKDYAEFLRALEKPEAARLAFAELSAPDPIPSVARGSLLESGIDPGDVGFILHTSAVLRRLNFWPELAQQRESVGVEIKRLRNLATILHGLVAARDPSEVRLDNVLTQIHDARHRISDLETAFADDMARATGRLKNMILATLLVAALAVLVLGTFLTRALFHQVRRSEQTARTQNEQIRTVVRGAQEVAFELDHQANVLFVNEAWTRMTGYPVDETLGRPFLSFVDPEEAGRHQAVFESCLSNPGTEVRLEACCIGRGGQPIWISLHGRATVDEDGRVTGASGTFTDITARIQAEGEIGTRERQQAAVAALGQKALARCPLPELMDEAVRVLARDLQVEFAKVLEVLPGSEDLLLRAGVGWNEALVGEAQVSGGCDSQAGYTMLSEAPVVVSDLDEETRFAGPQILLDHEIRSGLSVRILAQGRPFGVLGAHTRAIRHFNEDDVHFLEAIANVLSISIERVRAEEILRASEGRYRELMEHASDGILICEPNGTFVQANRRAREMTGRLDSDVLSGNIQDLFPGNGLKTPALNLDDIGADQVSLWETRIDRNNGETLPVEVSAKRIRGGLIQALVRDISERKHAAAELRDREEQLQQAQKMEALGRLAGGIAHDFNNLLTAILGYAGTGLSEAIEGDPLRTNLEEIKNAGETAAVLTRQLLAFSRKQVLTPVVFDLNEVVAETLSVLRRILSEHIEIHTNLETEVLPIRADRIQFEQVLLNLAVNARDAMPQGGRLKISTRREEGGNGNGLHRVILSVTDTGTGIEGAIQARIFEPFFTTKGVGKGTGLGLSTVYGIVQQSGGTVSVQSVPGHGSTFTISLPVAGGALEPKLTHRSPGPDRGGSETLLLVEDEEMVRTLTANVLRRSGYHVLEAADGAQALQILQSHPGPVHLLATDVIMPGMGGRKLADRVLVERPGIRILFMSGYTEDALGEDGVLDEGTSFLPKPFDPGDLIRMVRSALDTSPDQALR